MGKFSVIMSAIALFLAGCAKGAAESEPQEFYEPLGVYLVKTEWGNGETMDLRIYPPNQGVPPQQYTYIDRVDYFVNGESVGVSNALPFSLSYTPDLPLGQHALSLKLDINKKNVSWETITTYFTISEPPAQFNDKQRSVLAILNGMWFDSQFVNEGTSTCLTFGLQYGQPQEYSHPELNFFQHGECTFQQSTNGLSADIIHCFYELSSEADMFVLYKKEPVSVFKRYSMHVKNENTFELKDADLSLPYTFVKQQ